MATYPNSVKSFTTNVDGDYIPATDINDIQAEVTAVETQLITSKLSTLSAAPVGDQVLTSVSGVPTWAAKAPDADKLDGVDSTGYVKADGWIPVSSEWSYASATTITVPAGAASIYSVGMGIRLTANSAVKQAYIVKVENTLLTVAGDTLTNYTFSAKSYTPTPGTAIGFPVWFNWTATVTYGGGTTDPTSFGNAFKFMIQSRQVCMLGPNYVSSGSGNRLVIYLTLPVIPVIEGPATIATTMANGLDVKGFVSAGKLQIELNTPMTGDFWYWTSLNYGI